MKIKLFTWPMFSYRQLHKDVKNHKNVSLFPKLCTALSTLPGQLNLKDPLHKSKLQLCLLSLSSRSASVFSKCIWCVKVNADRSAYIHMGVCVFVYWHRKRRPRG